MLTLEYLRLANNDLTTEALPATIQGKKAGCRAMTDSDIALKFLDLRYT